MRDPLAILLSAMGFFFSAVIVWAIEFYNFLISGEWMKIQTWGLVFLFYDKPIWHDSFTPYKGINKIIVWILETRLSYLFVSIAFIIILLCYIADVIYDLKER